MLLAVAAVAGACGRDQDPTVKPDAETPVSTAVVPSGPTDPSAPAPPARVGIVSRAVDLRPHRFESAAAAGEGGRQLAIRFWSGIAPCSVLGRVDVREEPTTVTVTLFTGRDPAAANVACIEIAQYQEVVVNLAAPLGSRTVIDGAPA